MRKIVLGEDISRLPNLNVSMPSITSSITAIAYSILNISERAAFFNINTKDFRKSNYKFNQMQKLATSTSTYSVDTDAFRSKYKTGESYKVPSFAHLADPGFIGSAEDDQKVWELMTLDKWDTEDRQWEDISG